MSESPAYYPASVRLGGRERLLIWVSAEQDGVLVDDDRRPLAADSLAELQQIARRRGVALRDDPPALTELEPLAGWVRQPCGARLSCHAALSALNLADDIARAAGWPSPTDRPLARRILEKLFWGCNWPSVTPPGRHYTPRWRRAEVAALCHMLAAAIATIGRATRDGGDTEI